MLNGKLGDVIYNAERYHVHKMELEAQNLEQAPPKKDLKTLYRQSNEPLPDSDSRWRRWAEHLEELLNRPAPLDDLEIKFEKLEESEIDCSFPSKDEI
ncbi:unnamed protein product [Soboliphyme baturini]|uniref:Uncharacterized protein n=1 Tax=Soboliphyme baturini TaxID=241478 RepID=A0A183IWW4_9BILA|nr:unnamed protein product [Soboliphyme baturini]